MGEKLTQKERIVLRTSVPVVLFFPRSSNQLRTHLVKMLTLYSLPNLLPGFNLKCQNCQSQEQEFSIHMAIHLVQQFMILFIELGDILKRMLIGTGFLKVNNRTFC